jgi:hypothetical protein
MTTTNDLNARCSFCLKAPPDVGPLIEGPHENYICRECVDLFLHIFEMESIRRGVLTPGARSGIGTADPGHPDIQFRVIGVRANGSPVVVDELPMQQALDMQFRLQMANVLHDVTIEPIEPQPTR